MLRSVRSHLTYANVMATIAVFIALGGVSYAAIKLPKNSVGSAQLKSNAVTGAKVKNGSLSASDLNATSRSSLTGKPGPQGPAGPKGDSGGPGSAGTNGTPGASGVAGPTIISGSMAFDVWSPPGSSSNFGSEANALVPVPAGSSYTAKSFVASVGTAPGGGKSVTITLRINQADSALSCTISGAATGCEPPAGTTATVPAGSEISMRTVTAGVPAGSIVAYAYRGEF